MEVLERDGFLEQLDDLLAQASIGRGRLVVIRGEAGIGKTTLVEAFTAGRSKRVLWGSCDPLFPPRPLAPIIDIAAQVGGNLADAVRDPNRHTLLNAFLGTLRSGDPPIIVVLEDLQWADEGTLDILQVAGRRSTQLPAVIIGTVREEDISADHPLSVALGDLPPSTTVTIDLPPLSEAAVQRMIAGTRSDAAALYEVTGGNPFFLSEILATEGDEIPRTVRDAVLARARNLDGDAIRLLHSASILAQPPDIELVLSISEAGPTALSECIARGLLVREGPEIRFRHQIAQKAFAHSIPQERLVHLHARALTILRESGGQAPLDELVRHAIGSADVGGVLEFAPQAAERASKLGAHNAAAANYEVAKAYASRLRPDEHAALLSSYAHECVLIGRNTDAVEAQQEAIRLWEQGSDGIAVVGATAKLAEFLLWEGQQAEALHAGERALRQLGQMDPDPAVAEAYAKLAQVFLISGDCGRAQPLAEQAVALSEQFGDEAVTVHALNTLGCCQITFGHSEGWGNLESSLNRSMSADLEEETSRAFNNILANAQGYRLYDRFDRFSEQALAFFADHDLDAAQLCLIGDVVQALLDRGKWKEAETRAASVVERGTTHGRAQCLSVLARLAARRGDRDPWPWLDEAQIAFAGFRGDAPLLMSAARTEAAWLAGDAERAVRELKDGLPTEPDEADPWQLGELASWSKRLGVDWESPGPPAEPYGYYLDGYPEKAAAAWAALGCPYDEAQSLCDTNEPGNLQRALGIFRGLGADAAATRVVDQLKGMGARRILRGPRATTKANPAGLSNREVEVLALMSVGLRNADIAERLVVSRRTVDHQVSSILAKLGAKDRAEAVRIAATIGVEPASQSPLPQS
jgi:ATP/maltotriose-dependent transcriptional regulator MalT